MKIDKVMPETRAAERDPQIQKVARDFEAILVRQLLGQAKVAGGGGYADMAVESLASSVTQAGGLGLSRALEDALCAHRPHGAGTKTPEIAQGNASPDVPRGE